MIIDACISIFIVIFLDAEIVVRIVSGAILRIVYDICVVSCVVFQILRCVVLYCDVMCRIVSCQCFVVACTVVCFIVHVSFVVCTVVHVRVNVCIMQSSSSHSMNLSMQRGISLSWGVLCLVVRCSFVFVL